MGNAQKNDQKLISTIWLGVNDDWTSIIKERLSRISEDWTNSLFKCLQRFSYKEQNKFRNKIKLILTKKLKEDQYDELQQQSQIFLNNHEYLRQDIHQSIGISDLTISTNTNSYKINDTQSISSKIQDSLYNEDQNSQVQQFYIIFSCINDAFNNPKHPFIHFINSFKEWALIQLISMKNHQNNIHHLKQKLQKFQISQDIFFSMLIFSLNEYLGDFEEELNEDEFNKYIRDKQNYFNLCLKHIYDENLTNNLIDLLNTVYKNSHNNFIQKIKHIRSKLEFFEIPKKYLNQDKPFIHQISCLNEVQQLKNPAEIFYCLTKTYFMIKDYLTKSASSLLISQVSNYVIVHSNIDNFHALLHMLELFYCNQPILLKFNQSLDFIQNIIIT